MLKVGQGMAAGMQTPKFKSVPFFELTEPASPSSVKKMGLQYLRAQGGTPQVGETSLSNVQGYITNHATRAHAPSETTTKALQPLQSMSYAPVCCCEAILIPALPSLLAAVSNHAAHCSA
jgi:hypothetical protein